MRSHISHEAFCGEVERRLSAFLDGELGDLDRLGIERHLEFCGNCRRELEFLTEASGFLRLEGRSVPAAPVWASMRGALEAAEEPQPIWKRWLTIDAAIAASIALLALAGLLFAVVRSERPQQADRVADTLQGAGVQFAGLPGLDRFLIDHRAEQVLASDLGARVTFSAQVPEELPGGFQLRQTYVVRDRCCTGTCMVYRRRGVSPRKRKNGRQEPAEGRFC